MSNESITSELFAALDTVVMERKDDSSFKIIATVPHWFKQFYPNLDLEPDKLMPGQKFPVLENFLLDAESFWEENATGVLKSGLWTEIDLLGTEFHLEAAAVCLHTRKILLISLGEITNHHDKQILIQKARENNLNYYRLLKENQKKEILVHCIVHDLAGQLTGIKYCLELIALQNITPKALEYLEMGKKQCVKQEMLIREILEAFSAEVELLEAFKLNITEAPDALICAREVVNALAPLFSQNQIILQLDPQIDDSREWKVAGEKLRLERVISNLLENAFRYSPPNSTVTVKLEENDKFIVLAVDDEGAGVPEDVSKSLFQKFAQGKNKPGKIGLGLYFCRITVEHWGGAIGYMSRLEGGARFWFRLPKIIT